ncbi:MAG: hypothetical protein Q8Q20_05345 [bacterium]|nr:hypothetical protein [bacterium]
MSGRLIGTVDRNFPVKHAFGVRLTEGSSLSVGNTIRLDNGQTMTVATIEIDHRRVNQVTGPARVGIGSEHFQPTKGSPVYLEPSSAK